MIDLLSVGACLFASVGAWFVYRQTRKVKASSEQVVRDAQQLQADVQAVAGSHPFLIAQDEVCEVDEMIGEVIEESKRKLRKAAREAEKRQKRIERELAD